MNITTTITRYRMHNRQTLALMMVLGWGLVGCSGGLQKVEFGGAKARAEIAQLGNEESEEGGLRPPVLTRRGERNIDQRVTSPVGERGNLESEELGDDTELIAPPIKKSPGSDGLTETQVRAMMAEAVKQAMQPFQAQVRADLRDLAAAIRASQDGKPEGRKPKEKPIAPKSPAMRRGYPDPLRDVP